jgi:gamma-glutamyl-gamma-aminobutyrate hydrolase PuuD
MKKQELQKLSESEALNDQPLDKQELEQLIKQILENNKKTYDLESEEYNFAQLTENQIQLLNKAKNSNVDINKVFTEFTRTPTFIMRNKTKKPYIIPENILKALIQEYKLEPNIVLNHGVRNQALNIVKCALSYNADINYYQPGEDYNLLVTAMLTKNMEMVDYLIEQGIKIDISIEYYSATIMYLGFQSALQIIQKFSYIYSNEQLYEMFRSYGSSEIETKGFLDYVDLIKEYLLAKDGKSTSLSDIELMIIDGNALFNNFMQKITITNKFGYSLLHLSIIAEQYKLATQMVEGGFDLYAKTHNNVTPLQLLSKKENISELATVIFQKIENIDINLGNGESLADFLIENDNLKERIIELSNDPLFLFLKKDADLFFPSKDLSKTYIAISHGEDFWSSGIWSTARLIVQNYSDVVFHLVSDNILKTGGEEFIKQFDAIINPGARDTYPKLEEFTKEDCPFDMNLEKHYQNILELSEKFNIPHLGICAGAQHFVMYHGGSLKPLDGYNKGAHQVTFIEGTLSHFMASTKAQQKEILENCEFAKISFMGDTAHHYAAVNNKLGSNIQLGAVSEDGVPMSYNFINGIRYATQFHPEHHYNNNDNISKSANQKAWINNFVELARAHYNFRVNEGPNPIEIYSQVKNRLEGCLIDPTCLAQDGFTYYQDYV